MNHNFSDDLGAEVFNLLRRVEELEEGACRFNCKSEKEAFIAGFLWENEEDDGFEAYKEWKSECEK